MSKPRKTDFMALIAGEVAPSIIQPEPEISAAEEVAPAPVVTLHTVPSPRKEPGPATLKQRAHQLSVYLEPPVYDRLRDIAHEERTRLHQLMLEAVDLLLRKRGAPSIKELMRQER